MNLRVQTPPSSARTAAAVRAYAAFRDQRQPHYYRYALLRLGDPDAARRCVQETLDELALLWSEVLVSAHPAAVAWQLLGQRVNDARSRAGCPPEPQRDTELLSQEMSLSRAEISTVTGLDEAAVASHLLQAARRHQ
ncbi:hypothetical protein GCM10010329_78040 [Streptomyces spiroverticillatus]|uniref:Uncharacterized protein n=1 Tax=Streptomyces finlayi TaxID=67296 RepID=A0A919CDY5_9ACTN|nr:hypothetical protein [Streptomyces finlayi]GHA43538.1 hypothetical protein GCM10010329_78040 [Streptomyces spiroverticillatus]GHD13319.1 hypothetical protein GCM10010334_71310 [Streptomyces finlayi]